MKISNCIVTAIEQITYLAKEFFINREGQFKVTWVIFKDPPERIVILRILEKEDHELCSGY
jgi:hypothetical protein